MGEHLALVSKLARRLARFRAGRGLGAEVLPAGAARPGALPPDNGGGLAATIGQHLARAGHRRSVLRLVDTGADTHRPAYRDKIGRRLLMPSDQPVPMPADADPSNRFPVAGVTHHRGVAVVCSRVPHTVLVLGDDDHLVWQVATALDLT